MQNLGGRQSVLWGIGKQSILFQFFRLISLLRYRSHHHGTTRIPAFPSAGPYLIMLPCKLKALTIDIYHDSHFFFQHKHHVVVFLHSQDSFLLKRNPEVIGFGGFQHSQLKTRVVTEISITKNTLNALPFCGGRTRGVFYVTNFFYSELSPEFGQQKHTFYFKSRAIATSLIIY